MLSEASWDKTHVNCLTQWYIINAQKINGSCDDVNGGFNDDSCIEKSYTAILMLQGLGPDILGDR